MPVTKENLEQVMDHAVPDSVHLARILIIDEQAKSLAAYILTNVPPCEDQQAAIRHIREAQWTARQAILLDGAV